jgi:ATP-binding cassette subfamily B multidrug efflux pump
MNTTSPTTVAGKAPFKVRFARLGGYLRRYRKAGIWGIVALTVSNAFETSAPMFLRQAVDLVRAGGPESDLLLYAGAFVGITLCGGVARYFVRQTLIRASRRVEFDVRSDFFGHLLKLARTFYHRTSTGDLMARATSDVESVRQMIGPGIMQGINTIIVGVFALSLMVYLDWRLTLYALSPMLIMSVIVNKLANKIHDQYEIIQEHFAKLQAHAQENFSGVRVVKAYTQEDAQIEGFQKLNLEFIEKNMRMVKLQALFMPALALLIGTSVVIVLYLGGKHIIEGTLSLGSFVAFSIYLGVLTWPTIALGWVVSLYQRGSVSNARLDKIMDTEPEIATREEAFTPKEVKGHFEIHNLSFRYNEEGPDVLSGIHMNVEAGQTVAVVGPTGSGKSTLVHLLARLYTVPEGTVFVDGHDVNNWNVAALRKAVGFVPQEPFLFSDSLASNIGYGFDEPETLDRERIELSARWSHLAQDVNDFPKGYDTVLGERGITLSGGQKQRTALARALILDPPMLILDDAFSSVDTHTEEAILSELRDVIKRRTTILISHRVSTVKDADAIYVLEEGRLVEQGSHEHLVRQGGIYAEMYRKQLLEQELEEA